MESVDKRLLATTIDGRARTTPDERFAVIPQGSDLSSGFRNISMKDLAAAVNSMCWWIESTIGPAKYRETLAYLGNNDIRYFIFMIACQKTGYQVGKTVSIKFLEASLIHVFHRLSSLRRGTPTKPIFIF